MVKKTEVPEQITDISIAAETPVVDADVAPKEMQATPLISVAVEATESKPENVTVKVHCGTLKCKEGSYQKGDVFTVSRLRASKFGEAVEIQP
jgi:hypothetical protein